MANSQLLWPAGLVLGFFFSGCHAGNSGNSGIVGKWQIINVLGRDHLSFKEDKKQFNMGMEFTKDGKFHLIQDGVSGGPANYTLIDNGKTIRLTLPTGQNQRQMTIVSMTNDRLVLAGMIARDTIILAPQ